MKFIKFALNPFILLIIYIKNKTYQRESLFNILWERSQNSSADYVEHHAKNAMLFEEKVELYKFVATKIKQGGMVAEFGVFRGSSINILSSLLGGDQEIYGFDSFIGLKEDWPGTSLVKGAFNLNGALPRVNKNVRLIKGWFDQTLPNFLNTHPEKNFTLIHIDIDTYESTKTVLSLLANRIAKDTIIIFDEYLGYPNWQAGEFAAWQEFVSLNNINYEYLAICAASPSQVALIIK